MQEFNRRSGRHANPCIGSHRHDSGTGDLSQLRWGLEALKASDMSVAMPTGPSDGDVMDEFAANPGRWISVRNSGVHAGVAQMWELHGTWKRWPVLIDRSLLVPPDTGLQVVEGRTRAGILKGFLRRGGRSSRSGTRRGSDGPLRDQTRFATATVRVRCHGRVCQSYWAD